MKSIRRMIVLILLLAVPFQAAMGAGGMLCATMSGHVQLAEAPFHTHDAEGVNHHHPTPLDSASHHAVPLADAPDTPDSAGKCKVCSECCSAGAIVPATLASVFTPPNTPLRVSTLVDPALVSRSGDGLFRPPRTRSV